MLTNRQKIWLHKLFRRAVFRLPLTGTPSLFIVGAQKAGTTSLHEYLSRHPQIKSGLLKELHFFDRETNYKKGKRWYELHFKNLALGKGTRFIDATPEYMTERVYMERLRQYNSHAKLIVVLREPISRAYSAWNFYKKIKRLPASADFLQLIQSEIQWMQEGRSPFEYSHLGIVRYGCYADQLEWVYQHFPSGQVLIVGSAELLKDPHSVLARVFEFAEVRPYDTTKCIRRKRNQGAYGSIPQEARERLGVFYRPYNERLISLLGYAPDW